MGTGLNIKRDGTYLAFVAGTGILPFMDLIALMAKGGSDLGSKFKLTLFASFHTRADALGIELLEALDAKQKSSGKLYELHLRIKSELKGQQARWDADFISKQVEANAKATKIFVCGPPSMNELFDRTIEPLIQSKIVSRSQVDIL